MVGQLCEKMQVSYKFVDLDNDPKLRQKLINKTGFATVPITTDGTSYIAGWQPSLLIKMLKGVQPIGSGVGMNFPGASNENS